MVPFFLIPLKLIILMTNEALKLMQSKWNKWPYYINVYFKYNGYFNIDNEINYYF